MTKPTTKQERDRVRDALRTDWYGDQAIAAEFLIRVIDERDNLESALRECADAHGAITPDRAVELALKGAWT